MVTLTHFREFCPGNDGLSVDFNAAVNLIRSNFYKMMLKCFFAIIANIYFSRESSCTIINDAWDVGVFHEHMLQFIEPNNDILEKL